MTRSGQLYGACDGRARAVCREQEGADLIRREGLSAAAPLIQIRSITSGTRSKAVTALKFMAGNSLHWCLKKFSSNVLSSPTRWSDMNIIAPEAMGRPVKSLV